jgi:hypothetical protein
VIFHGKNNSVRKTLLSNIVNGKYIENQPIVYKISIIFTQPVNSASARQNSHFPHPTFIRSTTRATAGHISELR